MATTCFNGIVAALTAAVAIPASSTVRAQVGLADLFGRRPTSCRSAPIRRCARRHGRRGFNYLFASAGNLRITTSAGAVVAARPAAFQEGEGGERNPVAARWRRTGKNGAGFVVSAHDRSRHLVIAAFQSYSTYLGGTGTGDEVGASIAVGFERSGSRQCNILARDLS